MQSPYRHGRLDAGIGPEASLANRILLGPLTLGIEVTVPLLARECGLGNLDPQHRPDGGAVAAIEAAQDWPLPPAGSCLVTIRADADAYGAMAVLGLRAVGLLIKAEQCARIAHIGRADRFDFGAWPGPRPLPHHADDVDELDTDTAGFGALAAGLSDPILSAETGVAATIAWIAHGTIPALWQDRAARARRDLFEALRWGHIRVRSALVGRIAVVEGFAPGALRLGYRLAPVVIAVTEPQGGERLPVQRKMTIAQWCSGHADLTRVAALLNTQEAGWGGSPCIIGSPQGRPSYCTIADALAALRTCGA